MKALESHKRPKRLFHLKRRNIVTLKNINGDYLKTETNKQKKPTFSQEFYGDRIEQYRRTLEPGLWKPSFLLRAALQTLGIDELLVFKNCSDLGGRDWGF